MMEINIQDLAEQLEVVFNKVGEGEVYVSKKGQVSISEITPKKKLELTCGNGL